MRTTIACFLITCAAAPFAFPQKLRLDPAHVMGAQACSECHGKTQVNEINAWRATKHFKTFTELENTDKAGEIADNLDIDDLASDSLCVECHFTVQKQGARNVAISGISCESCHGAAKDWIKEHNKETIPRAERKAVAEKAGMLYPENIYAVASNCFDCHVVDREELVNKGGHPAFSAEFDLYAWSQGEVRHNFMTAGDPVKVPGQTNRAADDKHKRILFMVGKLLNLEYEMRAISKATTSAKPPAAAQAYGVQHAVRTVALIAEVEALNKLAPTDEVTGIIAAAKEVKMAIKAGQDPFTPAADKISALAKKFVAAHDGSELGAIDAKIPAPHGKVFAP